MNIIDDIILSIVQGISELFPISSLGHSIIIQSLLNIHVTSNSSFFLPFIVSLHIGTAVALIVFFYKEWRQIVIALFRTAIKGKITDDKVENFAWKLVVATIPVGIIGILFESFVKKIFESPVIASIFLAINGIILYLGEKLIKGNKGYKSIDDISFLDSIIIGISQIFALLPGISRSGASMVAGLFYKLNHEDAAYFSFMLATPVIFAAGALEIPSLFFIHSPNAFLYALIGAIISGITAYFAVKFLMKYFEKGTLKPYAYYSIIAGLISLLIFIR
jgi:undecaprenyl-diphosphatase